MLPFARPVAAQKKMAARRFLYVAGMLANLHIQYAYSMDLQC